MLKCSCKTCSSLYCECAGHPQPRMWCAYWCNQCTPIISRKLPYTVSILIWLCGGLQFCHSILQSLIGWIIKLRTVMWPEIGGGLNLVICHSQHRSSPFLQVEDMTICWMHSAQLVNKLSSSCVSVAQLRAHGYCISNQQVDLQYSDHFPSVMHEVIVQQTVFSKHHVSHVGHVQLQQYGFRTRLIFPSYFRLFLLRASLDQSKTSTKQKTKKPSQTRHTICGNNYSLCQEMSAQTKQVK